MAITIIENVADVTKDYIKSSLEHWYRGKEYEFSEEMLITLQSDLRRKAKNLDYIFNGKTRVTLKQSTESIYSSVEKNDRVKDFMDLVKNLGASFTKKEFVSGYLTVNKQKMRFSKAISILFSEENVETNKQHLTEYQIKNFTYIKLSPRVNPYTSASYDKHTHKIQVTDIFGTINKGLVTEVRPISDIKIGLDTSNIIEPTAIIDMMNSSDIILSLDINDYITCSHGSFSSCMGLTGSHHGGWMQHFRSDFSIIAFAHNGKDTMHKTGRSWLFLKMTEDGLPYSRPFYKLQKLYGTITNSHISAIDEFVQKQATDILGLPKPKAEYRDLNYGGFKFIVSPNMNCTTGSVQGTGYYDWDLSEKNPFWVYPGKYPVVPFTDDVYKEGPICILNFPDAIDLLGRPSNKEHFGNTGRARAHLGWNERFHQFVECSASKQKILLRDALQLSDGSYVHKDVAVKMLEGKTITPATEVEEVVPKVQEESVDLSEVDVCDF